MSVAYWKRIQVSTDRIVVNAKCTLTIVLFTVHGSIGGISSYGLSLMVARYLQEQSSGADVGSLLMGFLDFYGNHVSATISIFVANIFETII